MLAAKKAKVKASRWPAVVGYNGVVEGPPYARRHGDTLLQRFFVSLREFGRPHLAGCPMLDVIGPYPTAQQAEDAHAQIIALLHGPGCRLLNDRQRQRLPPPLTQAAPPLSPQLIAAIIQAMHDCIPDLWSNIMSNADHGHHNVDHCVDQSDGAEQVHDEGNGAHNNSQQSTVPPPPPWRMDLVNTPDNRSDSTAPLSTPRKQHQPRRVKLTPKEEALLITDSQRTVVDNATQGRMAVVKLPSRPGLAPFPDSTALDNTHTATLRTAQRAAAGDSLGWITLKAPGGESTEEAAMGRVKPPETRSTLYLPLQPPTGVDPHQPCCALCRTALHTSTQPCPLQQLCVPSNPHLATPDHPIQTPTTVGSYQRATRSKKKHKVDCGVVCPPAMGPVMGTWGGWWPVGVEKKHTLEKKKVKLKKLSQAPAWMDNVPEPVLTLMYHMQQFAARGVEQQHMPSRVGAASPAALLAGALIAQEEVKRRVKERVDQRRGRQTQ